MRLFVAVSPPLEVQERVWEAIAPLRSSQLPVRWVRPEGLHVTLKFLGDVAPDREREIADAVQESVSGAQPFSLVVEECGAFPSVTRPRVVWVSCEHSPPLELIQDRVERALNSCRFPNEARVFRPHITVGRVRRDAKPREMSSLGRLMSEVHVAAAFAVTTVDLIESVLRRDGARYARRYEARLEAE